MSVFPQRPTHFALLILFRFLLTKFGEPEPWTPEQVQVYLAKVRQELNNSGYHSYIKFRRVWVSMHSFYYLIQAFLG